MIRDILDIILDEVRPKYWAWLFVAMFLFAMTKCAYAQSNYGFEDGTLNGWTAGGGTSAGVITGGWSSNGVGVGVTTGISNYSPGGGKTWTINPYGSYMTSLQPGNGSVSFDSATTSLGLTSTENTAIKNYLTYQANNGGGGNPTPTNATWIKRTVSLQAGTTYTFAWNYLSTDYTPWNDGSMMTLTHATNANITPTLNNNQQRYALLGFTNPGTGNYATGSYGSTGWQVAVFTVPESGEYVLGFTSFNLGDTALSPILLIDQTQGTTLLNGQTFAPVAPNAGSNAPPPPSGETYISEITQPQLALVNAGKSRVTANMNRNSIYIDEKIGSSSNNVTIEQHGSYNRIQGLNGATYAIIDGDTNTINIKQGGGQGKNLIEFSITGNSNSITLWQSRTNLGVANSSDSSGHFQSLNIAGSNNNITQKQSNDGGANSGHYSNLDISGNSNTLTLNQKSDTGKIFFGIVSGANNVFDVTQQGSGSHYLDLTLSGNGHNANITQQGSGTHKSTISLSNVGGSSSLTVVQQGSTSQTYSISQQCANLAGCSVSITQGTQ